MLTKEELQESVNSAINNIRTEKTLLALLSDSDIETLLSHCEEIAMSETFKERVRVAIRSARIEEN